MPESTISPQSALVYVMVIVSASDRDMTESEMRRIGELVRTLPAFAGYGEDKVLQDAQNCAAIVNDEEGLEAVLGLIKEALPKDGVETAYALACDVAVADSRLVKEEMRILQLIRYRLGIDRLTAAALERAAIARAKAF